MSTTWESIDDGRVLHAKIRDGVYEIYETEPGIQRLLRDGRIIAETFTTEEAKRWAETYDKWTEQEAPKLPERPSKSAKSVGQILSKMNLPWTRFPRYPEEFV